MATQEKFVATHRFTGADRLVFYFNVGDEVVRLYDNNGVEGNGIYKDINGNIQSVEDSSMEPIETKPATKEQK